ncbi:hypothetical protein D3C87_1230260 [compost metagenome]
MMLQNAVDDRFSQFKCHTHFNAVFYVGDQKGFAHKRRNMVMRVVSRLLIFDKIIRVLHFSDVMVIAHNFTQQWIGTDFFSRGFYHRTYHHRVMISSWSFHDHFF